MRLNKTARLLTVAGLTLASAVAWGQATILNNGTGTPVNPIAGGTTATTLTAVNSGKGINAAGTSLSPFGGNGGPGAVGATATTGIGAGLLGSAHDFSGGITLSGATAPTGTAVGLCTYCHTPHKAKSTLLLWNHTLSANTFQWDVAATTSGTALPGFTGAAYNGPSAKCLSCHDGSVAIGDVGWFAEGATSLAGASKITDVSGNDSHQVGKGGNMSGTHPVAIPYPLNGAPNVYNGSTTGAQLASNDFVADPTVNNMRLYSDVGGGAIVGKTTAGQTGIECSTCHDPHNKATTDGRFLRANMTGNDNKYICLACHIK